MKRGRPVDCFFPLTENIDFVRINFENCEQIKIPVRDIVRLSLGSLNNDEEFVAADSIILVIDPAANIPYVQEVPFDYSSDMTTFQRILFRADVVSIDIHKTTGENLEVWLPYKENEKGFNAAEHCYIGKNAELHIEIKE